MSPPLSLLPALLASLLCLTSHTVHSAAAVAGCEYEGQLYVAGAKFKPDPCSKCHCPWKGGEVRCTVADCLQDDHCIQWGNTTKGCCPECEERGCRFSDGRVVAQGEIIKKEPCVRCYCPVGGGNPVCDVTSCPLSQCVDPVYVPGVCCPTCPNGPNCQIGLLTLPVKSSVHIEGANCTCESFQDVDGIKRTMVRCNKF